MSDDSFDDSFDSASGSDQEGEPTREIRVLHSVGPTGSPRPVSMFSGSLPPPSLYSKREPYLAVRVKEAENNDDSRCSNIALRDYLLDICSKLMTGVLGVVLYLKLLQGEKMLGYIVNEI